MSYDRERASELVLALMQLSVHEAVRTWKSYDWDVMNDLFERGYISDPRSKAKSVVLTDAGMQRSREMFAKYLAPAV
jgi:predicted GNAT superfamily acetyltransferase